MLIFLQISSFHLSIIKHKCKEKYWKGDFSLSLTILLLSKRKVGNTEDKKAMLMMTKKNDKKLMDFVDV